MVPSPRYCCGTVSAGQQAAGHTPLPGHVQAALSEETSAGHDPAGQDGEESIKSELTVNLNVTHTCTRSCTFDCEEFCP